MHLGDVVFPLYSARPGACEAPIGHLDGRPLCARLANNVLFLDPPRDLAAQCAGWRRVGARPRWNAWIDEQVTWVRNDLSLQPRDHRRWWGQRDHIRIWTHPSGRWAIGQAHREAWQRWPRRHHVFALDPAREAVRDALRHGPADVAVEHVSVPARGPGWDGHVLVATFA